MPQFVPVGNVAQLDLRALLWGQQIQNSFYFSHIGGAIGPGALDDLCDQINVIWYDQFRSVLARAYTFLGAYATDLTSATSGVGSSAGFVEWTGNYAGDTQTMPGSITAAITFRSAGRGKSQRGRHYWPGVPRNVCSGNQITSDYLNNVILAYKGLLPGGLYPVAGWQWVIVSRRADKAWRTEGAIIPVTDVGVADYNVDCMRRRLTGRGQ